MSSPNSELNSRDLATAIMIDLDTGLVPFIKGSPGIGKSAMIKEIARIGNLLPIIIHISMLEPTDVNGFPDVGGRYATFKTFEMFPLEGSDLPTNPDTGQPYAGWLLFLDEFNSGSVETQAACYSVILDKKVGQQKLDSRVHIVAAGNLKTDNAIVNTQSSAITSRVVNYTMKLDTKVFLEDVVGPQGWDYRVAGYLEWKPEVIHQFDPSKAEDPYACPRTWDNLQRRIASQGGTYDNSKRHNRVAAEGLVGQALAREFIAFLDTFGQIPSTKSVIADPLNVPVPHSKGLMFATIVQLRNDVEIDTLEDIYEYVQRFEPEFKIVFLKGITTAKNIPRSHPVIVDAQRNLRRRNNP